MADKGHKFFLLDVVKLRLLHRIKACDQQNCVYGAKGRKKGLTFTCAVITSNKLERREMPVVDGGSSLGKSN